MDILNIIITFIWIGMALKCSSLFVKLLRLHQEDQEFLVFALNILLLAGLNICIGIYTIFNSPEPYTECAALQKLYFGTSLFQLLLSYCVIERVYRVGLKQK